MKKFEYKIVDYSFPSYYTDDKALSDEANWLQDYGEEGWEMVGLKKMEKQTIFYFKREKT